MLQAARPVRTVTSSSPIGPRPAWRGLFLEPAVAPEAEPAEPDDGDSEDDR